MRTIPTAAEIAYTNGTAVPWFRVEVNDGSSWIDLSDHVGIDWLLGLDYSNTQDGRIAEATFSVKTREGLISLSPYMAGSLANAPNIVLAVDNQVRIDAAVVGEGIVPTTSDWLRIFEGRISEPSVAYDRITVRCRDFVRELADAFIETDTPYGDSATGVETVIQNVLTDWYPGTTLYTPNGTGGTPLNVGDLAGWNIARYEQKREPVMDAIEIIADTIAYDLRYRWHPNTSAFQLQIFAPDRTATVPDRTFTIDDWFKIGPIAINTQDIRNVVSVTWRDVTGVRKIVTSTNPASITKYRRRPCEISESQTSQIDSVSEATTLANSVLTALKDPIAQTTIDISFFPFAQLQDLYRLSADDILFDTDLDLACVSVKHSIVGGKGRTTLTLKGKPDVSTNKWLQTQQPWPRRKLDTNNLDFDTFARNSLCPNGDFSQWVGS